VAERLPKITSTICEKIHMATSTLRAVAAVRKTSHGPAEGYALYPLIVLVLFWGAKGHDRTGKCWISGKPVVLLTLLMDMFNHERVFVDIVQPCCVEVRSGPSLGSPTTNPLRMGRLISRAIL